LFCVEEQALGNRHPDLKRVVEVAMNVLKMNPYTLAHDIACMFIMGLDLES
jgi:hypothetical protein